MSATIEPDPAPDRGIDKAADLDRRQLADAITEDALQLLFTAHQDLREMEERGTLDPALLRSATECQVAAIGVLRVVATTILDAAWGPSTPQRIAERAWADQDPVAFDVMAEAWMLVTEDDDLLFANSIARDLLRATLPELVVAFAATPGRAGAPAAKPARFALDMARGDGTIAALAVRSRPLPLVENARATFLWLITDRDA